jgi:hypothetical protein
MLKVINGTGLLIKIKGGNWLFDKDKASLIRLIYLFILIIK